MTRLVTSGFEIYHATSVTPDFPLQEAGVPDGFINTAQALQTTGQRSGRSCFRLNVSAAARYIQWAFTGVLDRGYYARVYLKIATLPSANMTILSLTDAAVFLDTSGRVYHANNTGVTSAAINDGNWHRIEMYRKASATQANRAWELRVDGATVSSGTAQTGDSGAPTAVLVGTTSNVTADLYFDDLAVNDDQGSFQNSWPGAGYVLCLLPTADNSRGSWTGGGGGTTNLWDALNNTPPVGAASPGTNTSQISANAVATTGLFDTQTYIAAGATSGDTAIGCTVVACTGEQIATGTKSGHADTVNTVNNSPTATTGTLNFGLDVGAEGAWPQVWRWWASPFTAYASQPTLSSGARLGITTTTNARVADVCFLGLIVEMQPAPQSPAKRHLQSNQVSIMRPALR